MKNEELLSMLDVFRGLDEQDCQILADKFERRTFAPGEVICNEGERIESFSIVVSGEVDAVLPADSETVHRVSELKLGSFGPGEHFGEYCLLDMRPASATVRARGDVELLEISTRDLNAIINAHCEIAKTVYYNLALLLVDRLRRSNQELDIILAD